MYINKIAHSSKISEDGVKSIVGDIESCIQTIENLNKVLDKSK